MPLLQPSCRPCRNRSCGWGTSQNLHVGLHQHGTRMHLRRSSRNYTRVSRCKRCPARSPNSKLWAHTSSIRAHVHTKVPGRALSDGPCLAHTSLGATRMCMGCLHRPLARCACVSLQRPVCHADTLHVSIAGTTIESAVWQVCRHMKQYGLGRSSWLVRVLACIAAVQVCGCSAAGCCRIMNPFTRVWIRASLGTSPSLSTQTSNFVGLQAPARTRRQHFWCKIARCVRLCGSAVSVRMPCCCERGTSQSQVRQSAPCA